MGFCEGLALSAAVAATVTPVGVLGTDSDGFPVRVGATRRSEVGRMGYAIRAGFRNVVARDAFLYQYSLRASGACRFDGPTYGARWTSVGRARGRLLLHLSQPT
jgi:hypothetical protein